MNPRIRSIGFALFQTAMALLLTQTAISQQPGTGSIKGSILRKDTGDPLSKVSVELRRVGSDAAYNTITTEDDGMFTFSNVPPGEYRLTAAHFLYTTTEYGQRAPGGSALTVTVQGGQQVAGIRIAMTPAGTVFGRVTDPNGQSFPNAIVRAMRSTYATGERSLSILKETLTNDLGEYRLFGLAPGKYYISVSARDAAPMDALIVNRDGMDSGFTAVRRQIRPVANTVGASRLVPGEILVPTFFPDTTTPDSAAAVEVRSGQESNIDVHLRPVRLHRVRGTLTNGANGQSLTGLATVELQPLRPPAAAVRFGGATPAATLGPGGAFDIPNVIPGSYALQANAAGLTGRLIIEIPDRDLDNVAVTLNPRVEFSLPIHVTIEGRSDGVPTEFSVTDLSVSAHANFPPPPHSTESARPSSNGMATVTRLVPEEDYRLRAAPILNLAFATPVPASLQSAYVKSARLGERDVLNDGLRLSQQPNGVLEIVIGTNPGAITGRVINATQQPVPAVTVAVVPDKREVRLDLYRTAATDASGSFHLQNLPPGNYKVFAWETVESGAWFDPVFMKLYDSRGTAIRINEGGNESLALSVLEGN